MAKKPQLRGQKLLDVIEACIKQLASENEGYVYNASELARLVGCSRPTLNAKADFIDEILTKIGAEKRRQSEHPLLEQFRERIEDLESDRKALENELSALCKNHAKIYSTLLNESVDASLLIKPIVEDESLTLGRCILCSQKLSEDHKYPIKGTIVHLDDHRKGDS